MTTDSPAAVSRRAFLRFVGLGAGLSLLAACGPSQPAAPAATSAPAAAATSAPAAPTTAPAAPTTAPAAPTTAPAAATTAPVAAPTLPAAPTAAPAPTTAAAPATAAPATTKAAELNFWYYPGTGTGGKAWGEQAVAAFAKAYPNIKVNLTEKGGDIDNEIRTSAASKSGPDIFFYWDGYYVAWLGWSDIAVRLDDYVDKAELAHWKPIEPQSWNGHPYQAPWRLDFVVLVYNKKLWKQAGVDPEKPPATWPALLDTLEAIKKGGVEPLRWGAKLPAGGTHLEKIAEFVTNESIDTTDDLKRLVTGEKSAKDILGNTLNAIRDLRDRKLLNDDIMSLSQYQMYDEFVAGKGAVSFLPESKVIDWYRQDGADVVGVMPFPKYANGKLGDPHLTSPVGFPIATWSPSKEAAATFIKFTHTQEQLAALYKTAKYIPADDRFDPSLLETPIEKQFLDWSLKGSSIWPWDWVPLEFSDQMFKATGSIIAENKDPDTVLKETQDVFDRWREKDPETVQHYKDWIGH